jgi:hypothetical protein
MLDKAVSEIRQVDERVNGYREMVSLKFKVKKLRMKRLIS